MFHDLDLTLTVLLNDAPVAELPELSGADVSFETPDRSFHPAAATVNLFLHEIKENRALRHPAPIVHDNVRRRPPLRTDCSYLVTTWVPGPVGAQRVVTEHRLLGQALAWLGRFPTVPERFLRGALAGPDRIYPLPTEVAQLDPADHNGDFWAAMGVPPRPAFQFTVTIELDLGFPRREHPVASVEVGHPGEPVVAFGGRVTDAAGAPVPGARVGLQPTGRTALTDAAGRFAFDQVSPGDGYRLSATAPGHDPVDRPIVVPDPHGHYDLHFR
ncbi:Pvc16 family protein [Nonomuraea sp. NPDC050643]|uniref:Pvc16 family protein n=1 Tax=Nonomuraea sp. NPDC050643 TaxID=3155660 RepID=UPI0033E331BA